MQYQNIWTNDLEDGMTTLDMTLDLAEFGVEPSPLHKKTFTLF